MTNEDYFNIINDRNKIIEDRIKLIDEKIDYLINLLEKRMNEETPIENRQRQKAMDVTDKLINTVREIYLGCAK